MPSPWDGRAEWSILIDSPSKHRSRKRVASQRMGAVETKNTHPLQEVTPEDPQSPSGPTSCSEGLPSPTSWEDGPPDAAGSSRDELSLCSGATGAASE